MQIHEIRPKHKWKKRKRVGRGGKRGTYSGRGQKGQKSRAGRRLEPAIRGLIKRYPKLRGYRFKGMGNKIAVLNVGILDKKFSSGDKISPETLIKSRIIRKIKGKIPEVKILGEGEITKKLKVLGCRVSRQAKEKIEKAGGSIIA
jgi:large subunit ribosomal protein L15